jgi:predicted alpha/beta superfamily hydrolase
LGVATSGVPWKSIRIFAKTRIATPVMPPLASPSGLQHWFRAFLPPGYYENTLKKYPVLYMNDGHILFFKEDASREFLGDHR